LKFAQVTKSCLVQVKINIFTGLTIIFFHWLKILIYICIILDGHYLPESFYVAAIQARETLGKVLLDSVENKDFTIEEAVKIAKQIMFENSNKLYKLNLTPEIISNQGNLS